jgi:hypothetical protein
LIETASTADKPAQANTATGAPAAGAAVCCVLLLLPHLLVSQQVPCDVAARNCQRQDDVALVCFAHVPVVQQLGGQVIHSVVLVDLATWSATAVHAQ